MYTLLKQKKEIIAEKLFQHIVSSYPEGAEKYLVNTDSQFSNPIGYTLSQNMHLLVGKMAEEEDIQAFNPLLENIIRIRAVQEFSASEALSFIFHLKELYAKEILGDNSDKKEEKYTNFCAYVDKLMLHSFDIYMLQREKIYKIKYQEQRNVFAKAVDRVNEKYGEQL